MPLKIVKGELPAVSADAVVVPANPGLSLEYGIAKDVAQIAGVEDLKAALEMIAQPMPGDVAVTLPFAYSAKVLVHAMGPTWDNGRGDEADVLYMTNMRALEVAQRFGARSIALPLISAVTRQYPPSLAFPIAVAAARDFLEHHDIDVTLVLTGSTPLLARPADYYDIVAYIHDNCDPDGSVLDFNPRLDPAFEPVRFSEMLDRLIEASHLGEDEIRRRANMDTQTYWIITSMANYFPGKAEVFALALALGLTLHETTLLLACANLTLEHTAKFDVILEYFLSQGNHDIHTVNAALFAFDQPQL